MINIQLEISLWEAEMLHLTLKKIDPLGVFTGDLLKRLAINTSKAVSDSKTKEEPIK